MSGVVYLMDTSFMLELESIPGHSKKERRPEVDKMMSGIADSSGIVIVTAPVLLEYARRLAHMDDNRLRRDKANNLLSNIRSSLDGNGPWTIPNERGYLLKADKIIALAERSVGSEGCVYTVADLSIIQEAEKYQGLGREVKVLTFDEKLAAWESKA